MKNRSNVQRILNLTPRALALGAICLSPVLAHAGYNYFNIQSGSDCIMQDYLSVDLAPGIYDAIHQDYATSSDGGSGYFYGGFTQQNNVNGNLSTLVQYVCWPASGGYPYSYSQQIPFYAGTNMVGYPQIGEGSSCAIKGYWPQFPNNLWTREVVRYWQPPNGPAHQGFQGMWIKEPVSGNWYHVATFEYPFAITGVTGIGGWQENFSGYTGDYIVDHANGYYHKNGAWQMANQIQYTAQGYCYLINGGTATESAEGPDYTSSYNVSITLTVPNQPALPTFDPIVVSSSSATLMNTQLLVQWQMPLSSSPQLSYLIEVFNNSSYTGSPALTFTDNDPETHQKLLNIPGIATPYVRLTIADIFYNTNAPILLTPVTATPSPATSVAGTVGGLNYQYYTNSTAWGSLPDFSSLTPSGQGAVAFTDVTPRTRRVNYGFNYTGYITAPTAGLYAFTLHSGDGSELIIDGNTVINFDGLHDSSEFMSGGIALAAGQHTFNVQFFKGAANPVNSTAYTDGIGLAWEGPGIAKADVPASAYSRVPASGEPTITLTTPTNNAALLNTSPGLSATVTNNGVTVNKVQFYLTDYSSYYFRPSAGVDYYLGQDSSLPFTFNSMVWTAPTNLVRARLVYNGTNTIDSAPVSIVTTNSAFGPWYWTPLEMHNYPSGANVSGNSFAMVGDGMNMISRQVTGDCTFIARLANITPNVAGPDGIYPDGNGRAGIIFRGTTNTTIGQPLGDGSGTRFAALFSSVGGGTYFENDTMRGGNGDANSWSGNYGGANHWYKLQRAGDTFTSSISTDGANWTVVNVTNLPSFGTTIYAGVFIHVLQSLNPNVHQAGFDSYSLTGAGVVGPYSVTISPPTNAVVGGLPATFNTAVIGPVPASYQWQFNGTNIATATNASYTIASANSSVAGSYTVVANNTTSAPAMLVISAPAGSGVWTNLSGGSWGVSNNWSGGLTAGGVDAVADFSTLNLSLSPTVTLDGARTNGTLVFNDLNPSLAHNWTIATGSGGPLTLATSSGTPGIGVNTATNIISAVVAGTQGFTKSGPGYLTLSGASTVTGTINVNAGTLEMQSKSGDTPYSVAQGATLKIGYSTGGGYASTAMTIVGSGASATNGFFLAGGKTYNASGEITLSAAPTTIRQYGSGYANLGTFDINGTGLWCSSAASGSASDTNVQIVSDGYGMSMQVDAGANTATGDFTINGPLNVGSLGLYKRGAGSLVLNGVATTGNNAVNIQGGKVLCGVSNCLGANASVPLSSGTSLQLNGFNQTISSLNLVAGSTLNFGGTNTLTAGSATLAGTLQMIINKTTNGIANSALVLTGGTLTQGGTLVVSNFSSVTPAVGDTFTLFSAPGMAGNFTTVNLPVMPPGLLWDTSQLAVSGSIALTAVSSNVWNGGGTDNNWSTAANWTGSAPTNGQLLTFQGTVRQLNTNDFLSSVGQVTFMNGGFTLTGNPVSLVWGLVSQTGNNTWSVGTTLTQPQSFVSTNGILTVTAAITNGGLALTLDGPASNTISGAISGTGSLIKNGTGVATLAAANNYNGGTTVNAGKLVVGNAAALGGATAVVNAGGTLDIGKYSVTNALMLAGTGNGALPALYVSSATNQPAVGLISLLANATLGTTPDVKTNGISTTGLNLGGNTLTLSTGRLVMSGSSYTLTSGNLNLSNAVLYLVNGGAGVSATGTITLNTGSTLDVRDFVNTAASSVQGILLNGGTVSCGGPVATGPGNGGGTAVQIMQNALTVSPAGGTLSGNDTAFGGSTDQYYLRFSGALSGTGALTNNSTKGIEFDGDPSGYTGAMNSTGPLAFNGTANQTFNATLYGSGAVYKYGAYTLVLSGTNTYTGATTLSAGTVQVNSPETVGTSGPLGKSAAVNHGNISFAGGTLMYGPANTNDYSGRFSTAANQPVSVDINGQAVTFGTALTSAGGSLTLTNSGSTGRLALTAANTYTGTTTINGGTLQVDGSIYTNNVTVANGTLSGVGTINGATTNQTGTLAPGDTTFGRLSFAKTLTLNAGGLTVMKTGKTGSQVTNDLVAVTGVLTQGGTLTVTNAGGTFVAGDKFTLFTAGTLAGSFATVNLPALTGNLAWSNSIAANGSILVISTGPSGPASITNRLTGNTLSLTWPAGQGWRLVSQTNTLSTGLSTNWGTVPGYTDGSYGITVDTTKATIFYKLIYP